jgi:HlyD family secretion protein
MKIFKIATVITLVIAINFIVGGCTFFQPKATAVPANQIITVSRGSIVSQITPTGTLQMPNQIKLTFGAAGTIDEILVKPGDRVEENQLLAKLDASTFTTLQQAILQAEVNAKTAQMNLENAKTPTLSSSGTSVSMPDPLNIEAKEIALQSAKLNLENAKIALDRAIITAPFAGLIADVNNVAGDKVTTGTAVIRLIDPTQLEVNTLVNEMDVFNLKIGAQATVQITALSSVTPVILPATVSTISSTATSQGGVVNYLVKLKVSNTPISVNLATTGQGAGTRQGQGQGQLPLGSGNTTRVQGAQLPLGSGNTTRVQGAQLPPGMQLPGRSDNLTSGQGALLPGLSDNATGQSILDNLRQRLNTQASSGNQTVVSALPTLKEGLSVSITIIIEERNNVILVPTRAITRQGSTSSVQVRMSDNTTERRIVTTGLSDWQNKEITSGLTDGEKLILPQTQTSTTTPTATTKPQGNFQIPGMNLIR